MVLGHSLGCLVSNFVQTIQALLQLIVIDLLVKEFPPKASEPYFDRDDCFCAIRQVNGVSPIGVHAVVLYAHKTLGNSSGHAPFTPINWDLIILSKVRLVTSICPLARGCPGDEYLFLILKLEQNDLNL